MRSTIEQPLHWDSSLLIDVVQGFCAGELSREHCFDPKRNFFPAKERCFYHCEVTAKYCKIHFESEINFVRIVLRLDTEYITF